MRATMKTTASTQGSPLALLVAALALSLASVACGGTSPAIRYRMPMEKIAQAPASERSTVADAYRNLYESQLTFDHQDFEFHDIDFDLQIARVQQSRDDASLRIAKLKAERSTVVFKMALAKAADIEMEQKKKARQAQEEHIRYLEAQRSYLHIARDHARLAIVEREAAFELAKAKLAKKRNSGPKGFKLEGFLAQAKQARDRAKSSARAAKAALGEADAKKRQWEKGSQKSGPKSGEVQK